MAKPKKKPVAKKAPEKTRMAKKNVDPLADLGLDTDEAEETIVEEAVEAADTDDGDEAGREEVEVGDIEIGFSDFIPTSTRSSGGSKYPFAKLPAPKKDKATGKVLYANFVVKLQEGVDGDKLRRSVQSATTQANRQGADEGKYFVSRTISEAGEFAGMAVYRTDKKPAKTE